MQHVCGVLATPLILSCCTFFMLHFFHVALFSCCTRFMLHFFNVEKYWKWTRHRKHNQKTTLHAPPWTCSLLFWYPIVHFIHSFEWLIKWKGTNLLFCLERIYLPRLETFETRTKLFPQHKISCRKFNYEYENWGWMASEKYTRVEKMLVLALLFPKLLNHNYRPKQISLKKNILKNKVLSYLFHHSRLWLL